MSADETHNGSGSYSSEGHVRIYQLNDGSWNQLGNDIEGEVWGDRSSINTLSSNGFRIAIGGWGNDGNNLDGISNPHQYNNSMSGFINDNKGHVRVYDYTPTGTSSWTQVGGDINGDTKGEEFGIRVSF